MCKERESVWVFMSTPAEVVPMAPTLLLGAQVRWTVVNSPKRVPGLMRQSRLKQHPSQCAAPVVGFRVHVQGLLVLQLL